MVIKNPAGWLGDVRANTRPPGDSSNSVATTAYVMKAISNITTNPSNPSLLGTLAIQNANNVSITGGSINDILLNNGTANNLTLMGICTAPTLPLANNSNQLATTAFVNNKLPDLTNYALLASPIFSPYCSNWK
jgi:hypothetical protein